MNKKLLIMVMMVIFMTAGIASAQQKAFQFGFKVAPSMGWIKPNAVDYERDGVKAGFNWGFVGEFFLMENYAITTGFNVMYLNGAYTYPDKITNSVGSLIGNTKRELHLKYIQLPVILKMKTNDFGGLRVYGEMGFGLGFKVDAKADDQFTVQNSQHEVVTSDVGSQYRFTRESLILGAGVEYLLGGSTFITAGIRFDNNFIDIMKDQNKVDSSVEQKGIANLLELQIGLLF
ncbi:MAG: porin family protein [Bacteroidales bacterium]|nr:porin family protein [Bacteroidales bacterium]